MEIRYHRIRDLYFVRREDELVGPTFSLSDTSTCS